MAKKNFPRKPFLLDVGTDGMIVSQLPLGRVSIGISCGYTANSIKLTKHDVKQLLEWLQNAPK